MNSIDDLVDMVRDELGIPVTSDDLSRDFDQLAGWDSVYLLHLAMLLERETGRPVSLPELLEARSLEAVYTVAVPR
jgi:acyl carrier protein